MPCTQRPPAIVAWHLAAEHPERVCTLTAVSVPHPTAFGTAIASDPDQQVHDKVTTLIVRDSSFTLVRSTR